MSGRSWVRLSTEAPCVLVAVTSLVSASSFMLVRDSSPEAWSGGQASHVVAGPRREADIDT